MPSKQKKKKKKNKAAGFQLVLPTGLNTRKFIKPKRHLSPCEVRNSPIHGSGIFATDFIPQETKIIEYIGEKIDKDESDRRGWEQLERAQKTGEAGVYLFTLNDDWDVDGNFDWNVARLINHSCDPNCESWVERNRIWIWSIRDIEAGEELSFNYGFDLENFEDHPCRCGTKKCVGFIAGEEYWPELKKKLAKKKRA